MPRLYRVRGLPGRGKSTFARSLGIFHIENDMYVMHDGEYDWRPQTVDAAEKFCHTTAELAMQGGMDLVVSCTFTLVKQMQWYIDTAKNYRYSIHVIKASGNYRSAHNVPEATLAAMRERWEDFEGEIVLEPRVNLAS